MYSVNKPDARNNDNRTDDRRICRLQAVCRMDPVLHLEHIRVLQISRQQRSQHERSMQAM